MDPGVDRNRPAIRWAGGLSGLLYLIPLLFLALFFFYPLLAILGLSLAPAGRVDLSALGQLVSSSYYVRTLWFTIWQATVSTLLTVGLALPGAYVFARYQFRGKTVLLALTTIPFVLPTVVVAVGESGHALLAVFSNDVMVFHALDHLPAIFKS